MQLVVNSKWSFYKGSVGGLSGRKKKTRSPFVLVDVYPVIYAIYTEKKKRSFSTPLPKDFLPFSSKFWWWGIKFKLTAPVFVKFTAFGNGDFKWTLKHYKYQCKHVLIHPTLFAVLTLAPQTWFISSYNCSDCWELFIYLFYLGIPAWY